MNVFYVDKDPTVAAAMLCDKHVVKMVLESAQLLSTAMYVNGDDPPYKPTHINHPSAIWSRKNRKTAQWLLDHFYGQLLEYTKRYGKVHKSANLYLKFRDFVQSIPDGDFTDPPLCMPDKYKGEDPVESYRNFYLGEKMHFAKWNHSEKPYWVK